MSDTPSANPPEDPAQLRKKLDDALKINRENNERIRRLEATNTVHDAGLSHLNEHQRNALLGMVPADSEITVEVLKETATNLGFPSTPPSSTTPPTGQEPPAVGDENEGEPPTVDPGTNFLTPAPGSAHPDPRVTASISGLTQQEYAHIMGLRAQAGMGATGTLDDALNKATSKAEAIAAIRQHGTASGILLDSDLD